MMMAAMKAKQGFLDMADIVDTMVEKQGGLVSTKKLVDEGAELGTSLPVGISRAVFPNGGDQFPDRVGIARSEFEEGLEFGMNPREGDVDKFMGVVHEMRSSCSAGWQPFSLVWFLLPNIPDLKEWTWGKVCRIAASSWSLS